MHLIPTRYFSEEDLEPSISESEPATPLLPSSLIRKIDEIAHELQAKGSTYVSRQDMSDDQGLLTFVAFLRLLGAVSVVSEESRFCLSTKGQLACDVPYVVGLYLRHGFCAFDDWSRRYRTLPERLSALEFLHHLELRRIESSKRSGIVPEAVRTVPVSFALIKARSEKRGKDVYLFELNKDWNRYNLIGGKQQPRDGCDHLVTLYREIEEEIGIPRERVLLTPLTREPLKGYSLSGSRGSLSYYPCMLYWARIRGPLKLRTKDRWFTKEEILKLRESDEPGLMINDVYLDFILHELPGGLEGLDYSLDTPVESGKWYHTARDFVIKHKVWLVPLLGIIGALIKIVMELLE